MQFYHITISAIMAVQFLSFLGFWATWAMLFLMAIWDLVAVLCPFGSVYQCISVSVYQCEKHLNAFSRSLFFVTSVDAWYLLFFATSIGACFNVNPSDLGG